MSIKINGNKLEGELVLKGKLYVFTTDFATFPLSLQRPDTCEVEFASEILQCTVAESRVQNRYGVGKQRVLVLRVNSRKEKAVAKKPMHKIVTPAVTKEFKADAKKFSESHKEVLKGLDDKPKKSKKKKGK